MLDAKELDKYSSLEIPTIRKEKESIVLLNDRYNTPNTSLLLFHFEPHRYASSEIRLKETSIQRYSIEEKSIYIFDDFFLESESACMREHSKNASFSRFSYASQESREKGEDPARSMNNKEKWEFFAKPPQPIKEIYKLFQTLSELMNADISTLPWDICDENICASAVATNRVERVSRESMEMGKHEDINPEEGIPFGIPILYSKDHSHFASNFVNGAVGHPWLVSFMLYTTEDNFLFPDYGAGTVFCSSAGETEITVDCRHTRFVLFESDILHAIAESKIPLDVHTWRVSYVFKLMINPREADQNMKDSFYKVLQSYKAEL